MRTGPALFTLALVLLPAAAWWAVATGRVEVPPRWNPWAPLDVAEAPGPFTRLKLGRLSEIPAQCRDTLAAGGARFAPLEQRLDERTGCGWTAQAGAVRVQQTGVQWSSSFVLSCPAAVSLLLWERHALQPAAEQHLGSPVRRIDHLGSYACRNVYGRSEGRRSEHAGANALDIAAFRLADGRQVSVLRDWQDLPAADPESAPQAPATPAARFLADAHAGACRFFSGVLGPGYNAAHRDHFHLDRGPHRVCR